MRTQTRPQRATRGLLLGAGLVVFVIAAWAQKPSTRTLRGQVLDENDKAVASAIVHLTDVITKEHWSGVTDKEGRYQFNEVRAKADYEIYAEFRQQKSRPKRLSQFDPRSRVVFNLKLEPARKPEEKEKKEKEGQR